jgi:hypothetical protein
VTALQLPPDRPLGCLIEEIKEEDPEVKKVEVVDSKGYRTSASSLIGLVLKPGSKLMINDVTYNLVHPSLEGSTTSPQLVVCLHEVILPKTERVKPKEEKLAELKLAIEPFEATKKYLDAKAMRASHSSFHPSS